MRAGIAGCPGFATRRHCHRHRNKNSYTDTNLSASPIMVNSARLLDAATPANEFRIGCGQRHHQRGAAAAIRSAGRSS